MTPLTNLITRRIQTAGPISLADYMSDCLLHPEHGYYTQQTALGADGDFTTAPEISQMFGELIGLALAQAWLDQGAPSPFTLAELGPGRGTLMADVLRVGAKVPGFVEAAQITLLEASPRLRDIQAKTLAPTVPRWIDTITDLPPAPLFLLANEFFDALPIRQFERGEAGWSETVIGLSQGALTFARAPAVPIGTLEHRWTETTPGQIVELCPTLPAVVTEIATRIKDHGGAALIIDYGDWRSLGDTFQALTNHAVTDPLAAPGQADLTAHVDFEAIAQAAQSAGAAVSAMTPQGAVLHSLGIGPRAARLATALPEGPQRESHLAAYRRLTDPQEMGSLFKVIGLTMPGAPLLAGLDP